MKIEQYKHNHFSCKLRKTKKNNFLNYPRIGLVFLLVTFLLLFTIGPFKVLFDPMLTIEYLQKNQCCAIVPFLITFTILTIVGIPGTFLTIASGVVFGLWWGTLWSVLGATLGSLGAFWTARYLLRDYIKRKLGKHKLIAKFNQAVANRPICFVLTVRFAPISPFNVVNFIFGLTPLDWFSYTWATFVGIIPGTLAYTWLGTSGIEAFQGGERLPLILAICLLSLLSILPACSSRIKN